MSKDALAGVYSHMLTHDSYRQTVAQKPEALNDWDLSAEEKAVLLDEARIKDPKVTIGSGPVMKYFSSKRGAPLSPPVASSLGVALNQAAGLPVGALKGPGFLAECACCPWGHAVVGTGKTK
jgi:hypothetical protein